MQQSRATLVPMGSNAAVWCPAVTQQPTEVVRVVSLPSQFHFSVTKPRRDKVSKTKLTNRIETAGFRVTNVEKLSLSVQHCSS